MIQILITILFILSVILFISGVTKEVTPEDTRIYNIRKMGISIVLLVISIVLLLISLHYGI
jgi:uncharacterized membrane protein YdbT with pleckstrin-like domain